MIVKSEKNDPQKRMYRRIDNLEILKPSEAMRGCRAMAQPHGLRLLQPGTWSWKLFETCLKPMRSGFP